MAPLHLLLVVCFIGGISGQTVIFDLGSSFQTSTNFGTPSTLNPTPPSTTDSRRSCVAEGILYYTDGTTVTENNSANTILLTAPTGQTIVSISCFCNVLSVALQTDDLTQGVWIYTIFLDRRYLVMKAHATTIQETVRILYVHDISKIVIVSKTRVWCISLAELSVINLLYTFTMTLDAVVDITYATNTDTVANQGFDLFILTTGASYSSIRWDGNTVTQVVGSVGSLDFGQAIATDNGNIYILVFNLGGSWVLQRYVATSLLAGGNIVAAATVFTGSTHSFTTTTANINGLHICDSTCQTFNCDAVPCDCGTNVCGGCAATTADCQCTNSMLTSCCYSMNAQTCEECVGPIDACVFVRNAIALRRSGPDIDVVAVSNIDASISLTRLVDAGRYNSGSLPQRTQFQIQVGPPRWVDGFSIPVQEMGRGRRFGVYAATFQPAGGNPLIIPAIATENSGFTNKRYSYSVNRGDSVTLTSAFKTGLARFTDRVIWRYIGVDQTTGDTSDQVIPQCTFVPNRLNCMLTDVTKESNEGVYESYRIGRALRNWHPFFYLFVRRCPAGMYGTDCNVPCAFVCVHGFCDDNCGECICSPGWMGDTCETACGAADLVGAKCDIICSEIFTGNVDCKGLLISNPAKVDFACRSGLIPPECDKVCPGGYWGPNCLETCTDPCDARTGQ